jgi:SAM-dependent methyltransferase
MQILLENKIINKFLNIPLIWNIAQNVIGAKSWKDDMYPSVFPVKAGTILDFGCSSGNETHLFLDFDYYGVDLNPVSIKAAQEKYKAQPHVQFTALNIITDGFKKDFFDHVLFAGTAHHLTDEELRQIIDILLSNLKTGGKLHFFDPIRKKGVDTMMTRFIIDADQGKHVREEEEYRSIFAKDKYTINEWKVFPSPDRFIKFPDFLYIEVTK